jgi:hypothetical protein
MWSSVEVFQIWNTEDKKNRDRAYMCYLFPQIMHHALWFDGYVKTNMLYLMIMQTHGIKKKLDRQGERPPPWHCSKKKPQPSRQRKPPKPRLHPIGTHRNLD